MCVFELPCTRMNMYGMCVELIFSAGGANMINPKMLNKLVVCLKAPWQMKAQHCEWWYKRVAKPTRPTQQPKSKENQRMLADLQWAAAGP